MRILFTGTRENIPTNQEKIKNILSLYNPHENIIIHGDCSGVDSQVNKIATDLGFKIEAYPAEWKKYGIRAGPIRNSEMLKKGVDIVYALPYPSLEASRGTRDMVTKAQKKNISVKIVKV